MKITRQQVCSNKHKARLKNIQKKKNNDFKIVQSKIKLFVEGLNIPSTREFYTVVCTLQKMTVVDFWL